MHSGTSHDLDRGSDAGSRQGLGSNSGHSFDFALDAVLACVRWPCDETAAGRIREHVRKVTDWHELIRIADHHKVLSLTARNLQFSAPDLVPPEIAAKLRARAIENARNCFQTISELFRTIERLQKNGIEYRVLKGPALSIAAFGDATLRDPGDIDLLIREADIDWADRTLCALGYRRVDPEARLTPRRLESYVAHQKDFSYSHPMNGAPVDLHWRFFRNPRHPSNLRLEQTVPAWLQFGTNRLPVLSPEALFLYLCVHGTLDGWLRLKWLADIGALLRKKSPQEIRVLAQMATAERILPEFSAALLLCQRRLGFEGLPPECLPSEDPSVARILRFADRLMVSNGCCPDREAIPTTAWFLNELSLHSSLSYRMELVWRSLFRARVWKRFDLPDAFFLFYPLLSPLEWLIFRIRRMASVRNSKSGREKGVEAFPLRKRVAQLDGGEILLLVEAWCTLSFFRMALRVFPVRRLTGWMGTNRSTRKPLSEEETKARLRRVEWAIGAVVRHAPIDYVCFPQSLAAYFMLRRRGILSKLYYGVSRQEHQLKAHTWIKVGERTVVGGETEDAFTVLAVFP